MIHLLNAFTHDFVPADILLVVLTVIALKALFSTSCQVFETRRRRDLRTFRCQHPSEK